MSERKKPHNGRDLDGHRHEIAVDVEDLQTEPDGADHLRDDVRHAGAVADVGLEGARRAQEIARMVAENRDDVAKVTGKKH